MTIKVYTGLPASGKTSAIITEMEGRENAGGKVLLILSSEHEALTQRPNVKPQGLMKCRDQNKSHRIDDVIDSLEAENFLKAQKPGTLVVFDEAQYFQPVLVHGWQEASERGVDILVGTPSKDQLAKLEGIPHERVDIKVTCICGVEESTHVAYEDDLVYPTHLCNHCYEEHMTLEVDRLLEVVKESEPFPGDLHTYQPFFDIEMNGWGLVRKDCMARLNIILDAVSRCGAVSEKIDDAVEQPSFVDLGCCSGFFADGMTTKGFLSSGVDVSEDFIQWASQLAVIKGQAVTYTQQDLLEHLTNSTKHYDVISTFATVQWVMAQKGYEAGIRCFDEIFDKADSICVIEMGYTSEPIYNDKITDRPSEIDRDWVLRLMEGSGKFDTIELHPSGENGIWRDIFVGFRAPPTSARKFDDFPVRSARQTSIAHGYWNDTWAGKKLDVGLQAEQSCGNFRLEGWRPDDSVKSTITVSISAQVIGSAEVGAGVFNIELPVSLSNDDFFDLTITSSASFSPEDDERQLSYIIRELGFS